MDFQQSHVRSNHSTFVLALTFGLVFWEAESALAQCPTTYEVDIIVPTCNEAGSLGGGISESGDIAGWYSCNFGPQRAFGWFDDPPIVTVPLVPGYAEMRAFAINSSMEIAGITLNPGPSRAFLYNKGQSFLLPLLPNTNSSEALGLHQASPSIVVGYCANTVSGPLTAVIWEDGGAPLLLNLPLGPNSVATAISDKGQIVGWMGDAIQNARGFLWHHQGVIDLGIPNGHDNCRPTGINNGDQICGRSSVTAPGEGPTVRGWVWSRGQYTMIDPLPQYRRCIPSAINDDSVVVGLLDDAVDPSNPDLPAPAFIWKDGVMTALSDLVPSSLQLRMDAAEGINNAGQIIGSGNIQGIVNSRAVRLTPTLPVIGDVNCDRSVNVVDLLAVINQWGPGGGGAPADLNHDGAVNLADLTIVLDNWT